jgi:hypothetical protein
VVLLKFQDPDGGARKNKSVVLIAQNDALVVLIEHRSILQGFGDDHMYTLSSPILYSEAVLRGTHSPVSTRNAFAVRCKPEGCMVPLGFCSGGFTSTAGYVPGKRGSRSFDLSGFAPFGLIISLRHHSFLSK